MHKTFLRFSTAAILFSLCVTTFGQSKGFDTKRMDTTADACNDFFQYTNGTWLRTTEIPASESRWGTFNMLADQNNSHLYEILGDAAKKKSKPGTDTQLLGDFYASCMNEKAINKGGLDPIRPYLKDIDGIKNAEDLGRQLGVLHDAGIPAVFGFGVGADFKNS